MLQAGEPHDDPYQTLGLSYGAGEAEIKAAFRKLAKRYHPDLNRDDPAATARFQAVNDAYDLLSDPGKRGMFQDKPAEPAPPPRPAHTPPRQKPNPATGTARAKEASQAASEGYAYGLAWDWQPPSPAARKAELRREHALEALIAVMALLSIPVLLVLSFGFLCLIGWLAGLL